MRKVRFRCPARFVDDTAHPAAAEAVHKSDGERPDMAHRPFSHIARHAERRDVRTHERREIDEHGNESAADRPPSVHGKTSLYRGKISVRFDDFTHDEPHEDKRHERGQRADGGKHPRKIGEHPSPPGIVHQNGKIALPFCLTLHKYLLYIKFVIANYISKKIQLSFALLF